VFFFPPLRALEAGKPLRRRRLALPPFFTRDICKCTFLL